jgi:hypothetical protein
MKRFQGTRKFMGLTLRMDEVKPPTLRPARASPNRQCGARHNVALDLDRMSMNIHLPMRRAGMTTSKQGKAEAVVAVTCLQMSIQNSHRSSSDDEEN